MNKIDRRKRVVIVGGGFGGLSVAQHLGDQSIDVTLIDRNNYHLFQPLLYQVATGGLSPEDISSPLRSVLSQFRNIRVLMDEVTNIFPVENAVLTKNRLFDYDYLILATGSENHYFGNDHWSERAPGLKTVEDALEIRNRVFNSFEEAEHIVNEKVRESAMTFVVVGGGPTGVEMSGALSELAYHTLQADFRKIDTLDTKIYLVEGQKRVLPGYPENLSEKARKSLEDLGVTVLTETTVKEVAEDRVFLGLPSKEVRSIPTRNVIWAAGNRSSKLSEKLSKVSGIQLDRYGRVLVNPDLTVASYSNLFVIGDLASFSHVSGESLPGIAPVAIQQGKSVAGSILRLSKGQPSIPFKYRDLGSMAVIGRHAAVADFGRFGLSGPFAWFLWAVIHIMNLVEYGNRLVVMTQWAWNYLTKKKGARLIGRKITKQTGTNLVNSTWLRKPA